MSVIQNVPFTNVNIQDAFFTPKINTLCRVTIQACLAKCLDTGRIANFEKAAGLKKGDFEGIFYNDSDVYKVLEGVAYVLTHTKDQALEAQADEIIASIAAAQQSDGYIQTYFTLVKPDEKWTDMNMHEDYCIGHLIEAGIAYKQATGKTKLYEVGRRAADLICEKFGPDKEHWVPGHQEIELALVKLYEETRDSKYLDMAEFLLEERGKGFGRGYSWDRQGWGAIYNQDHETVKSMKDAKGHAVRALYMYSGMTDVAGKKNNRDYLKAVHRLWDSVVNRNMYITGGVGSSKENEGFTEDYDLPNLTAYCETCASIAMVYWNHRLNTMHGDARYADIIEKEIYNGILSGISLSGDKFFYDNPLESIGEHHRVEWFNCSCCPTQLSRFIPSVGNYIYAADEQGIYVNQYIANVSTVKVGEREIPISIDGQYPFGGKLDITLSPETDTTLALRVRKPGWCRSFKLSLNGRPTNCYRLIKGYLVLERQWQKGDCLSVEWEMTVEEITADPHIIDAIGKVALQKGPVVYCFEEADNPAFEQVVLSDGNVYGTHFRKDLLGGIDVITVSSGQSRFIAVPYFAWDNRQGGAMKVWVDKRND